MNKSLLGALAGLGFLVAGASAHAEGPAENGGHKCDCEKNHAKAEEKAPSGDGVKKASLTEERSKGGGGGAYAEKKPEPSPAKKAPARKQVEEDPLNP